MNNRWSTLTAEDIWFQCDLYLRFLPPINRWMICIDLRLLSKCQEGPSLRSKDAAWSRGWILRLKKKIKINAKNPYGHFLARNGSKSTITTQKSGKVNKVLYCCRLLLILEKWMDITQLDISASKSCSLTMRPPLTSKTALPNILKTASNQWVSSKD